MTHDAITRMAGRLRTDVEALCVSHGRLVGSPGHREARRFVCQRLQELGCDAWRGDGFELPYEGDGVRGCTVAGVVRGRQPDLAALLVGAHYDSAIDAPCADDNAAAVAIALAAAGQLGEHGRLERDIVLVFFDAEEPPFFLSPDMGSARFWEDQRDDRPIHAAVVMDLVGHDVTIDGSLFGLSAQAAANLAPMVFVTGTESHAGLRGVFERAADVEGVRLVPTLNRYVGDMSDHGVFRRHGVPYLFLSCGRWEHYHMPTDTPDRLNYEKMAGITRQVLALLHGLDGAYLEQTGREQFHDTLDLEIERFRRGLGALWEPLLRACGLRAVTTRSDMDRLVDSMLRLGL